MTFLAHHDAYLGLDIGTSSMKIVELKRDKKHGIVLSTYASARGTNSLVDMGDADAVAQTATILREMLKRSGISSQNVVAALPSLSVFSSVLTLPQMSARDMEQAVTLAARNYVPSPLKDVVLGWTVIQDEESPPVPTVSSAQGAAASGSGPAPEGAQPAPVPETRKEPTAAVPAPKKFGGVMSRFQPKEKKNQEIFLTAAPQDLVKRYSAVVERLGLRLVALETESFPLSRSLLRADRRPALLVDIGDGATSFSIVDKGYLRLNQSIDIGGASLRTAIMQKLGVQEDEAERRKVVSGLAAAGESGPLVAEAIKPALQDILERSQNLRRLYEQKSRRQLQRTVLIGGGANLKGFAEFWHELSGLPTEVGNPWIGVETPVALAVRVRQLGPSYAVAVGLALREFVE